MAEWSWIPFGVLTVVIFIGLMLAMRDIDRVRQAVRSLGEDVIVQKCHIENITGWVRSLQERVDPMPLPLTRDLDTVEDQKKNEVSTRFFCVDCHEYIVNIMMIQGEMISEDQVEFLCDCQAAHKLVCKRKNKIRVIRLEKEKK
jgi:hypothetical protein